MMVVHRGLERGRSPLVWCELCREPRTVPSLRAGLSVHQWMHRGEIRLRVASGHVGEA